MAAASAPTGAEGEALRRVLGPFDTTCIVVGAIIGVGIFFTPTRVAEVAGSGTLALTAWAVGGVIALLGALTFAELGGMYAQSGTHYAVLRDAYGPLVGFLFVVCNATAIQAGAVAIIAIVCVDHAAAAAGTTLDAAARTIGAALLVGGLAVANAVGVRCGSGIQNATVIARILTLLVVVGLGVWVMVSGAAPDALPAPDVDAIPDAATATTRHPIAAICAALVPAFFAYGGWSHALWIGGEVRNPQRTVPVAIIVGVSIVIASYMLVNWAYLRILGYDGVVNSTALAADTVAAVWPGAGSRVVAGAVALSALGVLNAQLLSGPRLVYGMARDGRFFRVFGEAHARFATPTAAIALIALTALVLLVAAGGHVIDRLLTGVVFVDGIFLFMTGVALVVLRSRRPGAARTVRVPLYPAVPLLFAAGELAIVVGAVLDRETLLASLIGVGWIAGAGLLYAVRFRRG